MNRVKFLTMAALAATVMTSCSNDDEVNSSADRVAVKFSANTAQVDTRVSETNWTANDAIGIYMLKSNYALTTGNISEGVSNRQYETAAGGGNNTSFTPVGGDANKIFYPVAGDVKFIAYYPYGSPDGSFYLPVDVSGQTSQSAIDLLYARLTGAYNKNSSVPVDLQFEHKLVKLVFNITNDASVTTPVANGIEVKILGQQTGGTLNLTDGTVTPTGATSAITVSSTGAGTTVTAEAIVLPNSSFNGMSFTFKNSNNEEFTGSIPSTPSTKWESGNKYTYTVTLKKNEAVITGSIAAWGPGGSGSVTGQ